MTTARRASPRPRTVLTAIARTAARLCEAGDALIFQVEEERLRLVAKHGRLRAMWRLGETLQINRGTVLGRAVLDRRAVHVRDLARAARRDFKNAAVLQRETGARTVLSTPLLRGRTAIGAIVVRRTKVRPFTAKQIALLHTFADQAAIALENAGLLTESVLLGCLSTRFPKTTLEWDAEKMTVTNVKEANAFVRRKYRKGWEVEGL